MLLRNAVAATTTSLFSSNHKTPKNKNKKNTQPLLTVSMYITTTATPFFISPLSLSSSLHHHQHHHFNLYPPLSKPNIAFLKPRPPNSFGTFIEHVEEIETEPGFDSGDGGATTTAASAAAAAADMKHLGSPGVEVKELEELPEQWRRAKLAWLCKELPAHKVSTLVRILNAQRKWLRQDDATYVIVHCTRIRENEAAFKVYKWMTEQTWYRFDFTLATKLADYLGKERKFAKCREVYDDIINQGRVPSESTFHILTVAYLSVPVQGCLEEACSIYNRMIQLGGYRPRLSLHNSLFRALLSKPGTVAKHYLKQAEFIYHNLLTCGLEIQKDIYSGLIWLHSYQDNIAKERVAELLEEMKRAGIGETREVLLSILRASSKDGDVEEAERTWLKLLQIDAVFPSQAFVYRMEVFAKAVQPMKSLEIFRDMQEHLGSASVPAYHKIIEVQSKAQNTELAESLMEEFIMSDIKPLTPSFINIMSMYLSLGLHDKLESTFTLCLEKCRPNRTIYSIYLDSLVKIQNIEKAEEVFTYMSSNEMVGINTRSCNSILGAYLATGDYGKAGKIYDLMCQKKYDVDSSLTKDLEIALSLTRKEVKKPVSLKLNKEQREILVGLLLGGLRIESDEQGKKHVILFEFTEGSGPQSILKRHLYDQFHEWLHPSCKISDGSDDVPCRFSTISHSYFGFYADQFWPSGRPTLPKLVHRWLSPRVLAYWYMYGGYRTSSGDILLKMKGNKEGVANIVRTLRARSLECRIKRKGGTFWIGFLGINATWFWKFVEPQVLDDLKDFLQAGEHHRETMSGNIGETHAVNFDRGSDSDVEACGYSDIDIVHPSFKHDNKWISDIERHELN